MQLDEQSYMMSNKQASKIFYTRKASNTSKGRLRDNHTVTRRCSTEVHFPMEATSPLERCGVTK